MLLLQRASAGSGKTYTLAKKFIWYLITIHQEGKPPRLRTDREIADGLPRILAITFTNKATAEMKLRIVEKLDAIARAEYSDTPPEADFLEDFCKDLKTGHREVGHAARTALEAALNHFADFKVSTIDSFFQSVLRTFTYEVNMNDSYQVEIDSDYLNASTVESTLNAINDNTPGNSSAAFWLRELMHRENEKGGVWNPFLQSSFGTSIQSTLISVLRKLESEDFKKIRKTIDSYFAAHEAGDPLLKAYLSIRARIGKELKDPIASARQHARELEKLFAANRLDIASHGHRYLQGHLAKLKALNSLNPSAKHIFSPKKLDKDSQLFAKGVSCIDAGKMADTARLMYGAYTDWIERCERPDIKHWAIYEKLVPYLGMLGTVRKQMAEILGSSNSIQLSETSSILKTIINDEDAPFIYERMGSTLNHYLIDEFQDTSKMQWEVISPLLREGHGRGEDSLIIGDAKQSIYRFRNADPSLISSKVLEEFPDAVTAGFSREENTNWRSDRTIVEFNNLIFSQLSSALHSVSKGTVDFESMYANVCQFPAHRERSGYVEINFCGEDSSAKPADDTTSPQLPEVCNSVVELILSLLERGYRQKEIAVLVDKNVQASQIISSFVNHNSSITEGGRRIEFISEESLLVGASEAACTVMTVLRKMVSGTTEDSGENPLVKPKLAEIKCNFSYFALKHPELSHAEQMEAFLKEDPDDSSITDMLADMQAVAIPALIEAIVEKYVPEHLRMSEAVFLAALQDMALEFCEIYGSDVASFVDWWENKGASRSISSPEGIDAVQVMTIHKSKGLEFKCVIIPFAGISMTPSPNKTEWRWVETDSSLSGAGLPAILPVETTTALIGTSHEGEYRRYVDNVIMDNLNKTYVAFTRAVNELYIFTKESSHPSSLGHHLRSAIESSIGTLPLDCYSALMPPADIFSIEGNRITVGEIQNPTHENGIQEEAGIIEDYNVNSSPGLLHYKPGDDEQGTTLQPEAADADPRSEGNLLHAVMERVKAPADIPNAVRRLVSSGMLTRTLAAEYQDFLLRKTSLPLVAGWFSSEWEILSERTIWFRNRSIRPDRVMFSKSRDKGMVIDYKFGEEPEGKAHVKQVSQYMEALHRITGISDITGYIWYVKLDKTIPVFPVWKI